MGLAIAVAASAAPALAQEAPSRAGPESEISVLIRGKRGRTPADLVPSDLAVLEDGSPTELVSLTPPDAGTPWQLTIYFDYRISSPDSVRRAANLLARQVERLTGLGAVEIVVADPEPRTLLFATRDAELVELTLGKIALEEGLEDELTRGRLTFLVKRENGGLSTEELLGEAREALGEELRLLVQQHDALIGWVAEPPVSIGPRAVFLVSDALGLDPLKFYQPEVDKDPRLALDAGQFPDLDDVSRTLAVYGWTALPLAIGELPEARDDRLTTAFDDEPFVPAFSVKLGGKRDRPSPEDSLKEEIRLAFDPVDRLRQLADTTGGEVLEEVDQIPRALARLASSVRLRFRSPKKPDGEPRRIEVRPNREGLRIRAQSVVGAFTPEPVAEVRARRLLSGDLEEGALPILAAVEVDFGDSGGHQARLEARVGLAALSELRPQPHSVLLRITVAVHREDGHEFLRHRLFADQDLTGLEQWTYQDTVRLPEGTDGVAVLVEELHSRLWGGGFAALVSHLAEAPGLSTASEDEAPTLLPQASPIQLVPPPGEIHQGRVRFSTSVNQDLVSEVVFFLNGQEVAVRRREPFEAKLDLGSLPRRVEVVAVAYDTDGYEVGRDSVVLNETGENFWVRIIEPTARRRVGPVDVEANIKVPQGERLDRVDFYWNDRRVATLRQAPFRQRLYIPFDDSVGYIRVAAVLGDGRVVEDLLLMNAQRFVEQVAVNLVELYVVVTDRRGSPVRGLQRQDFRVLEDEIEQEIVTFGDAGNLPLTVGLAIDSSASMFIKLPRVQRAAAEFVESLVAEQDRAFVVGFGTEPVLVRATTGDLKAVRAGIRALRPDGRTALWESVVLSLLQLQSAPGRKALVMFFDGADEDEDFHYRTCLKLARQSGVPIYLILMNNEAARTDGTGFRTRSFINKLDKLTRAGGGRVYFVRTNQDLRTLYQQINDELRGHYLLAYYSNKPQRSRGWREVTVETTRRGLTPRTISGYYARPTSGGPEPQRASRPEVSPETLRDR
jgi:Ca-activated chloride channel family protein